MGTLNAHPQTTIVINCYNIYLFVVVKFYGSIYIDKKITIDKFHYIIIVEEFEISLFWV